jgi:hypothetical protein
MIQEGLVNEGIEIVKAIRNRYDGEKRNPWNEFECGSNYARSLASYTLLNAFSGFEFDAVNRVIGFNPAVIDNTGFRYFWSLGEAWGVFEKKSEKYSLTVHYGKLEVKIIRLPFLEASSVKNIQLDEVVTVFQTKNGDIIFDETLTVSKGSKLVIED